PSGHCGDGGPGGTAVSEPAASSTVPASSEARIRRRRIREPIQNTDRIATGTTTSHTSIRVAPGATSPARHQKITHAQTAANTTATTRPARQTPDTLTSRSLRQPPARLSLRRAEARNPWHPYVPLPATLHGRSGEIAGLAAGFHPARALARRAALHWSPISTCTKSPIRQLPPHTSPASCASSP